jgi:hypothetical protein
VQKLAGSEGDEVRLLMVIDKLKNAIRALPDLLSYVDEAIFFKDIRMYVIDKEVLSARMREKAHNMEKDISINGKPTFKHLKRELEALIASWKDKFPKDDDPTVRWSLEILDLYEKLFGE